MAKARSSRKRIFAIVAIVIVLVGAFIILRPRLWVKNKTAKVIVDGRLSESVKLYHGSDSRLLFYLADDPHSAYYYSRESGVLRCPVADLVSFKLMVFSAQAHPQCPAAASNAIIKDQSLEFQRNGGNTTVSWQAAPR